jgi:broad specificity phosphatase PhoE
MPLYLLRHGETVFNVAGRYQGQNDSDLTPRGIQQARNNGCVLSALLNDLTNVQFVSSPLGRTLKTSEIICETLGVDFNSVTTDDRVMEMNYGAWQGMTDLEIEHEYPGFSTRRLKNPSTFNIPGGGESYNDLIARVDSWLDHTREYWESDRVWVVVSHGGTGSVIRGRYLGLDVPQIRALPRPHDQFYELRHGQIRVHGLDLNLEHVN